MMELDLGEEYRRIGEAFALDIHALRELAIEGIASTWLDPDEQAALRREFELAPN